MKHIGISNVIVVYLLNCLRNDMSYLSTYWIDVYCAEEFEDYEQRYNKEREIESVIDSYSECYGRYHDVKWYSHEKQLIAISEDYPTSYITLDRITEDMIFERKIFHNGSVHKQFLELGFKDIFNNEKEIKYFFKKRNKTENNT